MKNKGFTLVELLAVIVILALIIGVAVPSTVSISNKIKKNLYCEKIKTIQNAAMLYGEDRKYSFGEQYNGYNSQTISAKKLVETGYLKKEQKTEPYVVDPRDKSSTDLYNMDFIVYIKYERIYVHFPDGSDALACVS